MTFEEFEKYITIKNSVTENDSTFQRRFRSTVTFSIQYTRDVNIDEFFVLSGGEKLEKQIEAENSYQAVKEIWKTLHEQFRDNTSGNSDDDERGRADVKKAMFALKDMLEQFSLIIGNGFAFGEFCNAAQALYRFGVIDRQDFDMLIKHAHNRV